MRQHKRNWFEPLQFFFCCLELLGEYWNRLLEEYSIVDRVVPEKGEKLGGQRV